MSPPSTDYTVAFKPCNQFKAYFHYVQEFSADFLMRVGSFEDNGCGPNSTESNCRKNVMIEMQGGEIIGVADSEGHLAMDFGAMEGRVPPLAYANPACFWPNPLGLDPLHMVCPIDYYEPLAGAQLRGRLGDFTRESLRTVEPPCGEVEQDEPGAARGKWYQRGTVAPPPYDEAFVLALVHSNFDPTLGAFSIGTTVPGLAGHAYYFRPQTSGRVNLDFSRVTADGKVYC